MQELSDTLQEISRRRGWNQSELAEKLGVSQPTISRIIRGLPVRSGPAIKKIGQALAAADERLEASQASGSEYSEIHEDAKVIQRLLERTRGHSSKEAEALDRLLAAIENYVVARSQSGK